MRSLVCVFLLACGSSTPASDAGTDAGTDASTDASTHDVSSSDVSTKDVSSDATCNPPQGTTCPTTAGNCLGIGDPCTKGGGQCPTGTSCDLDLSSSGVGICITILTCVPHSCGAGATCCNTAMTSNIPVCEPNQCLPSDCTAEM